MKKILAVGEDSSLLATRAALLNTTGASVTCCNSRGFASVHDADLFDLAILCHSLEHAARRAITREIHRRSPLTFILLLASEDDLPDSMACNADAILVSPQPDQLLRTTAALMERSRFKNFAAPEVGLVNQRLGRCG
jgi:CheY-like chemotaxis protein